MSGHILLSTNHSRAAWMTTMRITIIVQDLWLGCSIMNVPTSGTLFVSRWRRRHGCGACLFCLLCMPLGCTTLPPEWRQNGTCTRPVSMLRKNRVPTVHSFIFVFLTTHLTTLTETLDEHHEWCHQEYIEKCGKDTCTSPTPKQRDEIRPGRMTSIAGWPNAKSTKLMIQCALASTIKLCLIHTRS